MRPKAKEKAKALMKELVKARAKGKAKEKEKVSFKTKRLPLEASPLGSRFSSVTEKLQKGYACRTSIPVRRAMP